MARKSATRLGKLRRDAASAVERSQRDLLRMGIAFALVIAGAAIAAVALLAIKPVAPAGGGGSAIQATDADFTPPKLSDIPAGPEGDAIKRGLAIFDDPRSNAAPFVGRCCDECNERAVVQVRVVMLRLANVRRKAA